MSQTPYATRGLGQRVPGAVPLALSNKDLYERDAHALPLALSNKELHERCVRVRDPTLVVRPPSCETKYRCLGTAGWASARSPRRFQDDPHPTLARLHPSPTTRIYTYGTARAGRPAGCRMRTVDAPLREGVSSTLGQNPRATLLPLRGRLVVKDASFPRRL